MSSSVKTAQLTDAGTKRTALPDERFWIKYSQNHELPLSVTSSLFLHALLVGLVGLVLAGLFTGLFSAKRPPRVEVFAMGEGGRSGDPQGTLDSGEASLPMGHEAVKQPEVAPVTPVGSKDLVVPALDKTPLVNSSEAPADVAIMASRAPEDLSDDIRRAQDRLAAAAAKQEGQGGPGKKGAVGVGDGDKQGPKPGERRTIQEARKVRWTLLFQTASAEDYVKQLSDLGAIIAFPLADDKFLVFRDLKVKPFAGREETGGQLPKIQYADDDPTTQKGFAKLFGLKFTPKFFMAFFSEKIELELRELEKNEFKGDESDIEQTYFQFDRQANGNYKPRVKKIEIRKK